MAKCASISYFLFGIISSICSLGLGILAFIYADWIRFEPAASIIKSKESIVFFKRRSGIFGMTVLNSSDIEYVKGGDVSGSISNDFRIWETTNCKYLTQLRIARLALHACGFSVTGIVLLIFFGALIQWCSSKNGSHVQYCVRIFCGVLCMISAVCYIASIIVFHVTDAAEKHLECKEMAYIYSNWISNLKMTTYIYYSYMYYVTWGSVLLSIVASLIFVTSPLCVRQTEKGGRNNEFPAVSAYYEHNQPNGQSKLNHPYSDSDNQRLPRTGSNGHDNNAYYGAQGSGAVYSPQGTKSMFRIY